MIRSISRFLALLVVMTAAFMSGCTSTRTQEDPSQYVDSSAITVDVKAKLLADPEIKSMNISVKTFKDRVVLSGTVHNRHQRHKAVELAGSVKGVRSVTDDLIVKR